MTKVYLKIMAILENYDAKEVIDYYESSKEVNNIYYFSMREINNLKVGKKTWVGLALHMRVYIWAKIFKAYCEWVC